MYFSFIWERKEQGESMCVVLILFFKREKSKRVCVCCIDIIQEREEKERVCVCCIDIIGEREEQERVCVLY